MGHSMKMGKITVCGASDLSHIYLAAFNADAVLRGEFCPSVRLSVRLDVIGLFQNLKTHHYGNARNAHEAKTLTTESEKNSSTHSNGPVPRYHNDLFVSIFVHNEHLAGLISYCSIIMNSTARLLHTLHKTEASVIFVIYTN